MKNRYRWNRRTWNSRTYFKKFNTETILWKNSRNFWWPRKAFLKWLRFLSKELKEFWKTKTYQKTKKVLEESTEEVYHMILNDPITFPAKGLK